MKLKIIIAGILLLAVLASYKKIAQKTNSPIQQLRIYEIPVKNLGVFHDRFRDHAKRIMEKYHFNIIAIWDSKTDDKIEFVYLLEWKDEKTMKAQWAKFMADKEWQDIKKETSKIHGTFVESIQDRTLIPADYSPVKKFTSR